ncbi:MAG TPA: DUF1329 domain-containing protein [Myxococcales bacterium]|nr:DUF1329 domain-containing protein [Myxococcales bacterium]HIM01532.1 DUF1329 domain-containing protein [Myxococcales bacterium]
MGYPAIGRQRPGKGSKRLRYHAPTSLGESPLSMHPARATITTKHLAHVFGAMLLTSSFICFAHLSASAGLPDEGDCPEVTLEPEGDGPKVDAVAIAIKPGMVLLKEDLMLLRQLIPKELWRSREVFFHEGMRLVVGPCHRRYAVPDFFREATEKFAGQAKVDNDGNLTQYTAGLPFPQGQIDPNDKKSGAHWAFNVQERYIGAGLRGKFRISDFPNRVGEMQEYDGEFFVLKVSHRADLAAQDYHIPKRQKMELASGGEFHRPFNARHLAWRQFRPKRASERYGEPDDIFTYIPSMRKVRRAAISWVDGLYVPKYSVTGDGGGGQLAYGETGSISPTAGYSIAASEDMRRGLIGITLRANAYAWRIAGETDVLAPINANGSGYPILKDRNFGTSGLSFANDRWDVRHALILEGSLRVKNLDVAYVKIFVDYQTLQPLYWITRTSRQRLLDIGAFAYKFSDDLTSAPEWPGGVPASAFIPVAAAFYDAGAGAGGWRRESYDIDTTPPSDALQRSMTTSDGLGRGR